MIFKSVIFIYASLWTCTLGQKISLKELITNLTSVDEVLVKQSASPFILNKNRSPLTIDKRIIGGDVTTPHEYPFQVALFIFTKYGKYFCGGSLITNEFVITAAHCVEGAHNVIVLLGVYDLTAEEDNTLIYNTSKFIIHENWNTYRIQNDIALIQLPERITFNSYISPVRWATKNDTYDGAFSIIVGWGLTTYEKMSDVLRYVVAPVITNEKCSSYDMYSCFIKDQHMCTDGNGTIGSCNGDSGGSLIIDGIQVGIVSFGSQNCSSGNPSVYTRISYFKDWIDTQIATYGTSGNRNNTTGNCYVTDRNTNNMAYSYKSDAFTPIPVFGLFLLSPLLLL